MDTQDLHDRGLKLRRKMFGRDAVEKRMNALGDFGKPLQHIIKARQGAVCTTETGLQLLECMPPDGKTVQPGIVADDGLQVAGAADVKLKSIHAMLQSEIKSGEGVFRGITPGTTMAEQQNAVSRGQSRGFVARLEFLLPS